MAADAEPVSHTIPHPWFYRRPCWWLALAASVAVGMASGEWQAPAAWLASAAGACVLLAFRWRIAAICLAAFALYGVRTATFLNQAAGMALPVDATQQTVALHGRVVKASPAGDSGARILLDTHEIEIAGAMRPYRSRTGAIIPIAVRPGDWVRLQGRLERPRPAANPGGFDARRDWLRRGVALVLRVEGEGVRRLGRTRLPWWREAALEFRGRVLALNEATLSPQAALIANYFLLGDHFSPHSSLAATVRDLFRESGTIHLLVVSGTQVTLVLGVFIWLGWRVWLLRGLFRLLALAALLGYYLATDGDASVSRAAVMGVAFLGAWAANREADGENCLGIAALALLALNPFTLFDIGAQLSFVAVWSLLRLAPALQSLALPRSPGQEVERNAPWAFRQQIAGAVSACTAPAIAVAPLLAFYFHTSCWSGILANLVMAPIATAFLFTTIGHALCSALGIPLVAPGVEWIAQALIGWSGVFATPPLGAVSVFPPPLWLLLACFGVIAMAVYARRNSIRVPAFLTLAIAALLASERIPAARPTAPTLRAFDVGQGDALYLEGPDGSRVLIDAGPPGNRAILPALRSMRVSSLDALVVTHGDADHLGGAAEVLRSLPVAMVVHPPPLSDSALWSELQQVAWDKRVPLRELHAGDQISFERSSLTALWPPRQPLRALSANTNENSLVLCWDAQGQRVLLPGDLERFGEWLLLDEAKSVKVQVLKAGHHGSNTSTSDEWLDAVQPEIILISCGRGNRFGHPAPEMLRRAEARGIPVFRTDLHGMITVRLNQGRPHVTPYLRAP